MSVIFSRVYADQIGQGQANQTQGNPEELTETPKGKQVAKKRGRPGRKDNKEWQDEEIFMLINIWSTKEDLFNCRDDKYQNICNRTKAIVSIRNILVTEGIEVDNKQIQDKMTNLRNYFAAELRKMELEVALSTSQPENSSLILNSYRITSLQDQQAAICLRLQIKKYETRHIL